MIYELKQEAVNAYDKITSTYKDCKKIKVEFKGRDGLIAIKELQDIIFTEIMKMGNKNGAKQTDNNIINIETKKKTKEQEEEDTAEQIALMVNVSGNSSLMFSKVMEALETFAKVGDEKLNAGMQQNIHINDLENLYERVVKHFLLGGVIRQLKTLSK